VFKLITLMGFSALLAGCGGDTVLSETSREFIVLEYDEPYGFSVTLEDLITKEIYKDVQVSNTCDDYAKLKIDSIWTFPVTTYVDNSGQSYSVVDATDLCNKLEKML